RPMSTATSDESRASNASCAANRKAYESAHPPAMLAHTTHKSAPSNRRERRDLRRLTRSTENEPLSSYGREERLGKLLANAADQNIEHVRIAIRIARVDVFHELSAAHDTTCVMHQDGENPIFVRGQLERLSVTVETSGVR